MLRIDPIAGSEFGAIVSGWDCADVDSGAADELRAALHRYQLLSFPGQQRLTPRQEVAFMRAIDVDGGSVWRDQQNNPWEVYKLRQGNPAGTYQLPGEPGVLVLGKGDIDHYGLRVRLGGTRRAYGEDAGSQVLGGGVLQWHIDGAFYRHPPCRYTQMRCIEAPTSEARWLNYDDGSGDRLRCAAGSTVFASGRGAFDLLSDAQKQACLRTRVHYESNPFQASYALGNSANGLRVSDADAEREFERGQDIPGSPADDPAAQVYPLVWTCPDSGLQALMPQPRCMRALERESADGDGFLGVVESRFAIERLMRPAIDPQRVYVHAWRPGDLVIWNNHSLWHSATGKLAPGDRRVMHLTAFDGGHAPRCVVDPAAGAID